MEDIYTGEFSAKLKTIISSFKEDLLMLRANRPTPKLVEDIKVDYSGQMLAIKQLGSISVEAPRDIVITPWDKNLIGQMHKAIEEANLGVSVSTQAASVRVKLPELTEERKIELSKIIKSSAETNRIKARSLRDDMNKKTKDIKDEDERFRIKESLQKTIDKFNAEIESAVKDKLGDIEKS
ncbi:MAG TPA: ribosome-recycling factor [Candidatus Paceibacterota bacterium]